jgi:serine phosphatase RsbU (regulator of sigma subunit)
MSTTPHPHPSERPAQLRVLLVEDDDVDRSRVHRAVRRGAAPLSITDAGTVERARELLEREPWDCAVIDFNLPDGTVLDVLAFLADRERSVPVVVLTGGDDDARAFDALKLGAEDYLRKSEFALETLVRAVRYAIERHRLRRELSSSNARLQRELEIGGNIQTAILPRHIEAQGLELCARMQPATEVGGDYYDVLPVAEGCWIGIGDVAGHGMSAAVIMLMVQSGIAALCRQRPGAQPSEVVTVLNEVLFDNIKNRMGESEHVTLCLFRFNPGGNVFFAGAHEDIVLLRADEESARTIPTTGTWLGARHGIGDVTTDGFIHLEVGDAMVLYSDGLIEALDAHGEPFGLPRVCQLFEAARSEPVSEIHARIWQAWEEWVENQDDDLTLLVVRRSA